jgi:DNA repair exonuclease SbcCD ATPase subunit
MITKLVVEQFGPFRERAELRLDNQGLVLVRARNEVSAAADSNGSGKTSLLHAVCWGLFGEDLAGRRADAVACRFTEGTCLVRLEMTDALGEWGVQRTRRPAALTIYGVPGVVENEDMASVQEKVAQRLGFGLRTFKNAVVFGQGAFDRFAGASQDEQMRMLDEIQGVDFRNALKRAQAWRKDLTDRRAAEWQAGNEAAARAEGLRRTVATLTSARNDHGAQVRARVVNLEADLDVAARRRSAAEAEIVVATVTAGKAKALRAEVDAEQAAALPVAQLERASALAAAADSDATDKLEDLESRLAELLDGGACPTCRQPVQSRRKAIQKLFEPELKELGRAADAASKGAASARDQYEKAAAALQGRRQKVLRLVPASEQQNVSRYLARLEHESGAAQDQARRAAVSAAEGDVSRTKTDIDVARATPWSGQAGLDAAERELCLLTAAEGRRAGTIEKLDAAVRMADYCVEALGDRGVRSLLVDGVADFVNERVARHLEVLAAGEATTRMSATTDLKKGGARERISFKTEWAWGGVGPDDGSGGQDRREDLAVFAAMQDLAESRSARPFPLKAFDEPFDALDSRGKELAAAWVRGVARERGTALLVTHSEELAALAEPDVVWTVVMRKDGATVEVS